MLKSNEAEIRQLKEEIAELKSVWSAKELHSYKCMTNCSLSMENKICNADLT